MKKQLFTYAVIVHTKKESTVPGAPVEYTSEMVIKPTEVMAKNQNDVVFQVTRLIPAEHAEDPDNVEILVRPF